MRQAGRRRAEAALLLVAVLLLAGCSIKADKSEAQKKVDIETPMGGVHVAGKADPGDTGIAVYPGAKLKESKSKYDSHSANVNISTSLFGLKVVVLSYTSDAAPEKIAEFYRKELARYGEVLECHSSQKVGSVTMHGGGEKKLSCDKDKELGNTLELKVGTEDHQHVVGIKPNGTGSEFALVYVNVRGDGERETM